MAPNEAIKNRPGVSSAAATATFTTAASPIIRKIGVRPSPARALDWCAISRSVKVIPKVSVPAESMPSGPRSIKIGISRLLTATATV